MSTNPGAGATCVSGLYPAALAALTEARMPFLVGGAYALERYTGIARDTKDFDIFVHPRDVARVLKTLGDRGCRTEITFPHWLGKAMSGDELIDVIWSAGNGIARVDDLWFEHAVTDEVLGIPVRLCPPEETIWSKAFIMERERYDGADVAHLLRARAETLDWDRLVWRFGSHWRVLLSHLVLFGYIYPGERSRIPACVMQALVSQLFEPDDGGRVCRGTLLSREQFLEDVEAWGYRDARLPPTGPMSAEDVARWTAPVRRRPA